MPDRNRHQRKINNRERMFRLRLRMKRAGAAIGKAILFPFRVLAIPFKALDLFHNTGVRTSHGEHIQSRFWIRALHVAVWPLKILFLPLIAIRDSFRRDEQGELVYLIPPALIVGLLGFVVFQTTLNRSIIQQRYLLGARRAINDNNLVLAKTYFRRITNQGNLPDTLSLQWAVILASTGEFDRADQILNQIAPDQESGFSPAHRVRALYLASQFDQTNNEGRNRVDLEQLRWHLEHSGVPTAETNQAWASYYVGVKRPVEAIEFLDKATGRFPELYLLIADISKQNNLDSRRSAALRSAKNRFRAMLTQNPLDHPVRVLLSRTLAEQNEVIEAEAVLLTGIQLNPIPYLERAVSDFYVIQYDRATEAGVPFAKRLPYLYGSLQADWEYALPYRRIVGLTNDLATVEQFSAKRAELQSIITGNNVKGLDHCNLAHLLWQEDKREQAQWHLDQAWRMQDGLGKIADRLAQAFAYIENPDLEWASQLARKTIQERPDHPRYHETLGSILLLQDKTDQAIVELELGLVADEKQTELHNKLRIAYEAAGNPAKARAHAKAAGS